MINIESFDINNIQDYQTLIPYIKDVLRNDTNAEKYDLYELLINLEIKINTTKTFNNDINTKLDILYDFFIPTRIQEEKCW